MDWDTLLMQRTVNLHNVASRAAAYLRSRQSPNGGFCFYRWGGVEEPSLSDTWHAVASFRLLGIDIPHRDAALAFMHGFDVGGLDDLYHLTLTLDALGAGRATAGRLLDLVQVFDATDVLGNERVPIGARLERALRVVTLQHCYGMLDARETLAARVIALQRGGGWGEKPNITDTWLALAILHVCGVQRFPEATRAFIDRLQVASFGFTATLDSMYTQLDVAHAGLRACTALDLPIRYLSHAADYIASCQTEAGGFARAADALPSIALTHRGLVGLAVAGAVLLTNASWLQGDSGY